MYSGVTGSSCSLQYVTDIYFDNTVEPHIKAFHAGAGKITCLGKQAKKINARTGARGRQNVWM